MGIFSVLSRPDGFYASNITKVVDGETRYLFVIFFFVNRFIYLDMLQVDEPLLINNEAILGLKKDQQNITDQIINFEITQETYPANLSTFNESPEALTAQFIDGTDTVDFTLIPRLLTGTVMYLELEGYQNNIALGKFEFSRRKVIDGARIKFYPH